MFSAMATCSASVARPHWNSLRLPHQRLSCSASSSGNPMWRNTV